MQARDDNRQAGGSAAIPVALVLTFLVCGVVIGGALYYISKHWGDEEKQVSSGPPAGPQATAGPKPQAPGSGPRVGTEAPDIVGEDIDGKAFKLSDYRGKVVMLDFWGNW